MASVATARQVPSEHQWFRLRVSYKYPRYLGFSNAGLGYLGPPLAGWEWVNATLVSVGECEDVAEVNCRISEHRVGGTFPLGGQAATAFLRAFPKPDNKGPIGFAGSFWEDRMGLLHIQRLVNVGGRWSLGSSWAGRGFLDWRWLVGHRENPRVRNETPWPPLLFWPSIENMLGPENLVLPRPRAIT